MSALRRARLVVVALALSATAVLVPQLPVSADERPQQASPPDRSTRGEHSELKVQPGMTETDRGLPPRSTELLREEAERGKAAARRREEKRKEPEQRAARARSRRAFADLGAAEALRVAAEEQPSVFQMPMSPLHGLGAGEEIASYLSDTQALIEMANGDKSLVESTVPLRDHNEEGDTAPVDLAFAEDEVAGRLEPRNAIVDFTVDRSSAAVRFPGHGVGLETAPGADAGAAKLRDGSAFWANVARDTDLSIAAVPSGLRTFHVLRSESAPERLALDFDLPAGASLEPLSGPMAAGAGDPLQGAQVVRDGKKLVGISAPRAWDADGRPMKSDFVLQGHRFVIRIDHRREDVRYPIVVDPEVIDYFHNWKDNGAVGFAGQTWRGYRDGGGRWWGGWTYDNPYGAPKFNGGLGDGYLGRGLYIYNRSYQWFNSGEYGQWLWYMPRGARVYRADWAWLAHDAWGNPNNCMVNAGWSAQRWDWEPGTWWNWEPPSQTQGQPFMRCNNWNHAGWGHSINWFSDPRDENIAVFRNGFFGGNWAQNFTTYTGGSNIFMRDHRVPEMVAQELPSGWVGSGARFNLRGWDDGLGMRKVVLQSPATPSWSSNYTYDNGCTGTYDGNSNANRRCWDWMGLTGYVNNLAEGESVPIELVGTDIVSNSATGRWHLNVDRTAPTLSFSGDAYNKRYWQNGVRSFSVTAAGEGSTASASSKRSGVRKIQFWIDGVERDVEGDRPCPGSSCSATKTFNVDMGALAEGRHAFKVQATDWAGNFNWLRWRVTIDRGAPQVTGLSGPVHDDLFLRGASQRLHVDGTDGISPPPAAATDDRHEPDVRAGVRDAVLYLQGASGDPWIERARWSRSSCSTGNCTINADLFLNTADTAIREGRHNVRLVVSDFADNAAEILRRKRPGDLADSPWETVVDRGVQRPVDSGELSTRAGTYVNRPMTLHVEAPDGSTATRPEERSGMKTVELLVDGASVDATMPEAQRLDNASCPAGSCRISGDLRFDPGAVNEGWRTLSLRVTDFVGNTSTYTLYRVLVDRGLPTVRHEHVRDVLGWHKDGDTAQTTVIARDAVGGVKKVELHSHRLNADGTQRIANHSITIPCDANGQCPANVDVARTFTYGPDAPAGFGKIPEGRNSLSGAAYDAADLRAPNTSWAYRVDRTPPETTLDGSLKTAENTVLVRSAYELQVRATDGTRPANINAPTAAERAKERSGVRSIEVFTRHEDPLKPEAEWQWQRQDGLVEDCSADGSCARGFDWTLRTREFAPGPYSIKVETRDQLGHLKSDQFKVVVGLRLAEPQDALGLEEWYQLDSTNTGGDTQAHVNLGTGNVVWHSTPIVNPGRGLSSVVNLTYNSHRRSEDAGQALADLTVAEVPLAHNEVGKTVNLAEPHGLRPDELPVGYSEVGQNFSLGISGVTRLNEPLDVTRALAGGPIELTDADGTHHEFEPADGSVAGIAADAYVGPPGVELHLRRFSTNKPGSMTIPGQLGLLEDPKRTWAMTRSDGVTHFFDQFGYQTYVTDRDGNTLEFVYENRSATGLVCDVVELPGANLPTNTPLCFRKLVAVVDAAGAGRPAGDAIRERRSVKFEYYSRGVVDTSVNTGTLTPEERPSGRLKTITEHGGRKLGFTYAGGYLTQVEQATASGTKLRDWKLGYEAGDDPDRGGPTNLEPRYLETVTDPRGAVTDIDYERRDPLSLDANDRFSSRRVTSIRDRRDGKARNAEREPTDLGTQYRITDEDDGGRRFTRAEVADARSACNLETQAEGERSTPCHLWRYRLDDRARLFDMRDARDTQTLLTWDAENRLRQLVRAAGTDQASTTTSTYNHNGLLTDQTDPAGTIHLEYEDSAGPSALRSPRGHDEDGAFVSDLVALTDRGGHETTFTLDTTAAHVHKGRVVARRMPGVSRSATTEFDAATGVVIAETDEEGRRTEYPIEGYDENGLPRRTKDPKGGTWLRDFDAVGNMLRETDPRNASAALTFGSTPNATDVSFTTYLKYDGLDRLEEERAPKLTGDADASKRRWSRRTWHFDANGNLEFHVDAESARTDISYTPMDHPDLVQLAASEHANEDGTAREVTDIEYDEEENPREQDNDGGGPGLADDRRQTMTYDEVSQMVTQTRHSARPEDPARLVTSFAYDRRGNRIGIVDPARNQKHGNDNAAANATVPSRRRVTFEYDLADRGTAQVEDPGGLALRSETHYDADGNIDFELDPRNAKTEYDYNDRDLVTDVTRHVTDPTQEGTVLRRTHREYYDDGRVKSVTSPRGTATATDADFTTTLTYDKLGQVATRTLPHAASQYGPAGLKVTYERDAVGNPEWITDARGHRFRNTFYDTGDLRTTQQPTFWKLEAGQGGDFSLGERSAEEMAEMVSGRNLPSGEGHGDLGRVDQEDKPGLLPKDGTPELLYDDEMRLTAVNQTATERNTDGTATEYDSKIEIGRDPLGRVKRMAWPHDVRGHDGVTGNGHIAERYGYDRNGNRISFRSGTASAVDGGGGVETTVAYDGYDRVVKQTLPPTSDGGAGRVYTQDYDANGNAVSRTTPARGGATWRTAFDALDRPIGSQSPVRRTRDGQTTTETTCVGYDAAGNPVWERDPRGNLPGVPGRPGSGTALADLCPQGEQAPASPSTAGCDTDDSPAAECFTTRRWFNAANELVKERDGHGHVTTLRYDPNGNQVRAERPGARATADGSVSNEVTCREFDGRDLPWTETTGVPEGTACDSAGGSDGERTVVTEYDGNGNLIRQVNPAGVGDTRRPTTALGGMTPDSDQAKNATVYRYSTANQMQARLLPWDDKDNGTRWRQNFDLDARGRVERIAGPYKQGSSELTQITEYERYETGWIRRSKEEADDPNLSDEQDDPKAARGQIVSYEYDGRGNQTLWRSQIRKDGADVEKRRVERTYFQSDNLEKRTASAPGDTTRTYTYSYDANGQTTSMRDAQNDHTTHFSYDLADRSTRVNECWEKGDDTRTTYDEAGEVATRMTDGRFAGGSCADPADFTDGKTSTFTRDSLGREVRTVIDPEGSQANRRFDTTFWPSGEVRTRVKRRASGSDWAETVTESKYYERAGRLGLRVRDPQTGNTDTIDYDYDKNGNRTKDERGSHSFNARDQLIRWDRKDGNSHVTYGVNGAGAITSKNDTKDGSALTYKTIGDRIDSLTVSQSGISATYKYEHDDLGNVVKVFDTERPADAKSTVTYDYDPFNRLLGSKGEGIGGESSYTYDALDRRDTEKKGSQRFDLSYVGMSESLSQREGLATSSDGTETANGTKRFDYDSELTRLGMTSTDQQGATKYRSYATDANGSVIGLESDQDGSIADKDKYDYDPYGELEKKPSSSPGPITPEEQEEQTRSSIRQLAGVERNGAEDDLSPDAQENPFRYEGHYANSDGTYDMQARAYRPAIGRFLSEDRFEAASGDFSLQADPLTQNRYAFAGGNPINNVEFDGHDPHAIETALRKKGASKREIGRRLGQVMRSQSRAVGTQSAFTKREQRTIVRRAARKVAMNPQHRKLLEKSLDFSTAWETLRTTPADAAQHEAEANAQYEAERQAGQSQRLGYWDWFKLINEPDFSSPFAAAASFYKPLKGLESGEDLYDAARKGKRALKPFDVVRYGDKAPGLQKHHGVMDIWAKANVKGYKSRQAPAVVLTEGQHNATRAVFNNWRMMRTGSTTGRIDWKQVGPREMHALSEQMFDAAGVPATARRVYYKQFNRHTYGGG